MQKYINIYFLASLRKLDTKAEGSWASQTRRLTSLLYPCPPPLETGPSRLGARRTRFAQEGKNIYIFCFQYIIYILKTPKVGCPQNRLDLEGANQAEQGVISKGMVNTNQLGVLAKVKLGFGSV